MTASHEWFVCPTCNGEGGSHIGPWSARPEIQDGDIETILTSRSSMLRKEAVMRLMEGAWQDGWDACRMDRLRKVGGG